MTAPAAATAGEVERRVGEVDHRLARLEALADPGRETALRALQALVELYGEGLRRIMALAQVGDGSLPGRFAADPLISHLLLLHDLHPAPVEERVLGALQSVRPYLESHGGNVELVAVAGTTVRLRLEGSCHGCPSSALTLKTAIEEAIRQAAPEIDAVEAEVAPAAVSVSPVHLTARRQALAG